jgi:hypothetical protein
MPLPRFEQATHFDSVVPDAHQQALSERYIAPELERITAGVAAVRAKIDARFGEKKRLERETGRGHKSSLKDLSLYPYGFCDDIRDIAFASIEASLQKHTGDKSPFASLKPFLAEGGIFRRIWGELTHGPYFQNAMQIGAYYLDCANDTVVVTKPKLEVMPLVETNFRNVDSFEHYFTVASHYYKWESYPNTLYPRLAPLFPALAVHKESGVLLLCPVALPLMLKNLNSGGKLAEQFLAASSWRDKKLPDAYRTIAERHSRDIWPAQARTQPVPQESWLSFEPSPPAAATFARFRAWLEAGHGIKQYMAVIQAVDEARKLFDQSLRRYSLAQTG